MFLEGGVKGGEGGPTMGYESWPALLVADLPDISVTHMVGAPGGHHGRACGGLGMGEEGGGIAGDASCKVELSAVMGCCEPVHSRAVWEQGCTCCPGRSAQTKSHRLGLM